MYLSGRNYMPTMIDMTNPPAPQSYVVVTMRVAHIAQERRHGAADKRRYPIACVPDEFDANDYCLVFSTDTESPQNDGTLKRITGPIGYMQGCWGSWNGLPEGVVPRIQGVAWTKMNLMSDGITPMAKNHVAVIVSGIVHLPTVDKTIKVGQVVVWVDPPVYEDTSGNRTPALCIRPGDRTFRAAVAGFDPESAGPQGIAARIAYALSTGAKDDETKNMNAEFQKKFDDFVRTTSSYQEASAYAAARKAAVDSLQALISERKVMNNGGAPIDGAQARYSAIRMYAAMELMTTNAKMEARARERCVGRAMECPDRGLVRVFFKLGS